MAQQEVKVPDMACGRCLNTIKQAVAEVPGVSQVEGNVESKTITVTWDAPTTWEQIDKAIRDVGFSPE